MINSTEQIIQSTRFLESDGRVTCVCCGQESFNSSGYCSQCHAPIDLSQTAQNRGLPVNFVSVLGASGAGKTVFIGVLLDVLSKGVNGIQGLPTNSFSVAIQQHTIAALEARRFPDKTSSEAEGWQWVHCEVKLAEKRKNCLDVVTPDFAGEAIAAELDHPGSHLAITSVISQSKSIILLIDSLGIRDSGRDEDFFGMKMASYILNLRSAKTKFNMKRKSKVPLAIVLTKSDSCPEAMEDPERFATDNMPGFARFLERNFQTYQFFASGVVGATAVMADHRGYIMEMPLHIEPRGVTEPLEWIIRQK
ncbi:MAG: hypothetical protein CMJ80_05875 [Planctomycetaceae bacterium]|nr:hypothetical protein [Planctomycetaceae bacterium]